jgi:hypothetical protein
MFHLVVCKSVPTRVHLGPTTMPPPPSLKRTSYRFSRSGVVFLRPGSPDQRAVDEHSPRPTIRFPIRDQISTLYNVERRVRDRQGSKISCHIVLWVRHLNRQSYCGVVHYSSYTRVLHRYLRSRERCKNSKYIPTSNTAMLSF